MTGNPTTTLNTEVPHSARVYDYMLGGTDNFAADRKVGDDLIAAMPWIRGVVRANRAFLQRAVRFAAESGVGQFLDLGAGLPTSPSTHEVARQVIPDARVAYVDTDPILLDHARKLLGGGTGGTAVVRADVRDPAATLSLPELRRTIDFDKPVAVMLIGLMHLFHDADDPYGMVAKYLAAVPSGSMLLFSQFTADFTPETAGELQRISSEAGEPVAMRTGAEIARFFDGLDLVEPGLVQMPHWRPDGEPPAGSDHVFLYAGVARKP
ncbi:SAM-dependent methyltransferase [Kibdelosporangium persicum]|uniref:O-methyltransferase involved in polyketide biosynthesis n=1 Tax=Kibdelosporangium persicum TaxID=2698649 RepID=A0ABX2F8Q2_9PSEU|nr:SAM-dependent methyltransferase [Kibdelosporangium persicum]NRN67213.1 O-methyltransferase involved in polyketide biosynthesis [Kibdelosporangium persicum]